MTLIVEDGSGVYGANSYVTISEADAYFLNRGNTSWADITATTQLKEEALIRATDFIERKYGTRFSGFRLYPEKLNAEATLTFAGNPTDGDTVTIGDDTYTFVDTLTNAYDVQIQTRTRDTMSALIAAVNGTTGYYHPSTVENADVDAIPLDGRKIVFQANFEGDDGNDIEVSKVSTVLSWNFSTLVGGNELGRTQPLSYPRDNVFIENVAVKGIPDLLKFAQMEYAVRALGADLMPDPVADDTGRIVVAKTEKVGPIEETVRYSGFVAIENAMRDYPGADRLLRPLLGSGGTVSR
jgi:hypothetical protein